MKKHTEITRRSFLNRTVAAGAAFTFPAIIPTSEADTPPNVIIIFTDDQPGTGSGLVLSYILVPTVRRGNAYWTITHFTLCRLSAKALATVGWHLPSHYPLPSLVPFVPLW